MKQTKLILLVCCLAAFNLAATIKIDKIINHTNDNAYIIVPGIQTEDIFRAPYGQPKPAPSTAKEMAQAMQMRTLPVYKIKDGYVIHRYEEIEEPLTIDAKPGEQIIVATPQKGLKHFEAADGKELIISSDGSAEYI